jgi:RimK family alpha-L-glutamate ligase
VKIAILSRDGTLYSCKRLREAAIARGHLVEILDPLSCYMNIDPAASSVHYKGRQLPHFDAVIPRIGSAITFYGTAALRQFEMLGSYPLNESVAITRARDKLRSLQLLARQGIDLPVTGIAHSPDDTSDLIAMVGGAPLVVKLVEGTQGIGVVLAETRQAAESVIDAFRGLNAHILVQEYIEEAKGGIFVVWWWAMRLSRRLNGRRKRAIFAPTCIAAAWPAWRQSLRVSGRWPLKPHRHSVWMSPGWISCAPTGAAGDGSQCIARA